ncbi:hypothetical protein GGX14DRAFT_559040 [Mycena pura]|uniref:Uncharacterized protein n=1 Tax=Mycena pura TaxID=153505 RepID=A0AAD6VSM8_9AGAR|nr:hypothetical protein GGX14DRAFT_559040 [Mycena pura]
MSLSQIRLALLDPTLDAKEDNITKASRIGELETKPADTTAFSPSTPRTARPPTPRTARPLTSTPLATVTNLLRTPTLKSPKPPIPIECPVSDELQQY